MILFRLLIGSIFGGRFSDRFGRKTTLCGSIGVIIPSVMFGGYTYYYVCYVALRLLATSALPCVWISNQNLLVEVFGKAERKNAILAKEFVFPISQLVLTLIVYFVR